MVSSPTLPPRENVRRYLRVLSAFKHLHNAMQPQLPKPHEALYEQSTYRLQLWLEKIVRPGGTVVGPQETISGPWGTPVRPGETIGPLVPKELPPLDVAMALHSYMLCPQRYFEDAMLRFRELELRIGDYPFAMIVDALKPDNQGYDPDRIVDASRHWEKETGSPFDPVQFLLCDVARSVKCPYDGCGIVTVLNSASFNGGKFQYVCCCRKSVTDEALRVKKFLSALAQAHRDPLRFCLPNTANLVEGVIKFREGLASLIYDVFKCPDGKLPSVEDIMQAQPGTASGSGMVRIRSAIVSKVDHTRFRISSVPILLHAFEHPYPFTQDIVAALLHHNEPCVQDCDNCAPPDVDLDRAYTLYAEFLDMVLEEGRREPGPEADLIWHAHQLTPRNYREYVVDQLNVFLDHLIPGEDLNAHRRSYDVQRFPEVVTVWRQGPQLSNLSAQRQLQSKGSILCNGEGSCSNRETESCLAGFAAHAFLCCDAAATIQRE